MESLIAAIWENDYAWLCRRLGKLTGCTFAAEDFAAEAFAQLMTYPDLETVREPRALLTTIAQRLVYESWRKRDLERGYAQVQESSPELVHPSAEQHMMSCQTLQAVDSVLEKLSVNARTAFLHSKLDGLTYAEIASRLKVSTASVQQYVAMGLQRCNQFVMA